MSKEQLRDKFYTLSEEDVLSRLDATSQGLTSAQAKERLESYGRNELEEAEKRTIFQKFLDQFKDLMIIILLAAAGLSIIAEGVHGVTDAIIVLLVVVLNAAFGVYQEGKAEAAIDALKSMSSPSARVLRDGHTMEVDSKELVP
ncbi:ATPase, partial [Enterococcus faecalis]|nr:ATPase [Enterococcus faecalis]